MNSIKELDLSELEPQAMAAPDLTPYLWTPDLEPDKRPPILTWANSVHLRRGTITIISGKAKSAKSSFVNAAIASLMGGDGDFLGWGNPNHAGGGVILADMEQPQDDWILQCRLIFKRAGMNYRNPPRWLYPMHLRNCNVGERFKMLESAIELANAECGRVALLHLDGVTDLMKNPNDLEESAETVQRLMRIADTNNLALTGVLHTNEGEASGLKVRGHVGSESMRKADNVIVLEKDGEGVSSVWTTNHRKAGVLKSNAFRFAWNDDAEMHTTAPDARAARNAQAAEKWGGIIHELFAGDTGISKPRCEIVAALMAKTGRQERACQGYFRILQDAGLVQNSAIRGHYQYCPESAKPSQRG